MEMKQKPSSPAIDDRLSSLHDSILLLILSFLPTKESIGTSVLAKRYRHIWAAVPALSFALISPNDADFVDRALARHSAPKITSFCIVSGYNPNPDEDQAAIRVDGDRVLAWIDYAVNRSVQQLKLHLIAEMNAMDSLYQCQSLESLVLDGLNLLQPLHLPDLSAPIFCNIRNLNVEFLHAEPGDWIGKLISDCFQLEDLSLTGTFFDCLDICAPKLRKFVLAVLRASDLRISCPELKDFILIVRQEPMMNFQGVMPSLQRTIIRVTDINSQGQRCWNQILRSAKNATVLQLLSCVNLKFASMHLVEESERRLPVFNNLKALLLSACFHYGNIEFILYLLEHTPSVMFLMIQIEPTCSCVDKKKKWRSRKLPSNVLDNLKIVQIINEKKHKIKNEGEVLKFLSNNVRVWEKVIKIVA